MPRERRARLDLQSKAKERKRMIKRHKSGATFRRLAKILFEKHESRPENGAAPFFLLEWSKGEHDALVYAATHLAAERTLGTRTVAYWPDFLLGFRSRIWARVARSLLLRFSVSKIALTLKQLGISDLVVPGLTGIQRKETDRILRSVIAKIATPADCQGLQLDGVLVGDLLYDSALKDLRARTIPIGTRKFHNSLRRSISLYVFWKDWLTKHDVAGVAGRHAPYRIGLPLRQASHHGAISMQIGRTHFSKVSPSRPWHGPDYDSFPTIFRSLPDESQLEALRIAEQSLEERLQGRWSEATHYMRESAYGPGGAERIFEENGRRRIIVFTHAFFDAPHGGGLRIFPDYWEWLTHLGNLSKDSSYDWFVKPHPAGRKEDRIFLSDLVERFPSLKIISPRTSNTQILSEGCDLALTLYGSVAVEFAWRGVPVINGGSSPNRAYGFAYQPRDVEHLDQLIHKLPNLRVEASREEILEFEFMNSYFYGRNILYEGAELREDYFTRNTDFAKSFISRSVKTISRFITSDEKALPALGWREKSGRV